MKLDSTCNSLYLTRSTAITLLVRLENGDIPYPHSKQCRDQMVFFLSNILTDEERNGKILEINFHELNKYVNDIDTAFKIIQRYSIM